MREAAEAPHPVPRVEHHLDRPLPHPLDRAEAEADRLPHDGERVIALVDVGRQHADAHVAALAEVLGDGVRGGELGVEHRRHEGHGVVRLQIRRLVGQHGVGDAVALVEAVAGEGLDVVPQLLGLLPRHPALDRPRGELLLHLGHDVDLLLAHGLAQHVRLGHGEAGDRHGNSHDLFLVDDDPVGLLQDLLGLGRM